MGNSVWKQRLLSAALMATAASVTTPAMSSESWRAQNPVLRIGVAQDTSIPKSAGQYERFRTVIEKAVGMPVDIFVAANLAALIDAHANGRVDYAPLPLIGYYTVDKICDCTEPLVAPTNEQGANALRSVLLVNKQRIKTLDDLAGQSVAIGPAVSVVGSLVPLARFQFNAKPLDQADLTLVQVDSFEEMLDKLADGSIAAAFGWEYADTGSARSFDDSLAARALQRDGTALDALWRSEPIPLSPHLVATAVPDDMKRALATAMLSLHTSDPLAFDEISPNLAGPMLRVTRFDYKSAFDIIDTARPE